MCAWGGTRRQAQIDALRKAFPAAKYSADLSLWDIPLPIPGSRDGALLRVYVLLQAGRGAGHLVAGGLVEKEIDSLEGGSMGRHLSPDFPNVAPILQVVGDVVHHLLDDRGTVSPSCLPFPQVLVL